MVRALRFSIVLTTVSINFHTYTMYQKPSGTITYNYKDAHGEHSVVYKAYPEGTLKTLQAHAQRDKKIAFFLLLPGAGLLAAGTVMVTFLEDLSYAFNDIRSPKNALYTGVTLTTTCALFGARAGFRVIRANRMIKRHVDTPQQIKATLNDTYLKHGTHEFFIDLHKTKPLEDVVNR